MKTAQDYMSKYSGGEARGGFNSRLQGYTRLETLHGYHSGSRWAERNGGWELADEMIKAGKIFSEIKIEKGRLEFKCYPDGDQWCCISPEFENLQESSCFAFGETHNEAVIKFIDVMSHPI